MNTLRAIFGGRSHIDFVPLWRRALPVSAFLVLASLVLLATAGLNMSIEFEGGAIFEVPVSDSVTVDQGRGALTDESARVQLVQDPDRGNFIRVQTGSAALSEASTIVEELADFAGVEPDAVSINAVGPTWGDQITAKAVRALIFFFVAVSLYLAWRLEWRMAVGALTAVLHDLIITAGIYSLVQFEVSPATVIALLTIMGYSLYDTVVVFDKVLEKQDNPGALDKGYTAHVSRSMNLVLMRSINTTITTLLPVLSMLVIGALLLGGVTLRDFALALAIGLVLGTYSSIFVAAPVLSWLKERQPDIAAEREKREKRLARKTSRSK